MRILARWIAGVSAAVGIAIGVFVGLSVLPTVTAVHAGPTCDTSWAAATSGDWGTAANWTAGVPTSSTNACITLAGTYTVSISGESAQAKTITLGASSGATRQTLAIVGAGCGPAASLTLSATGSTVKHTGIAQLTANTVCSGNAATLNVGLANTLTNTGVIDIEPGNGGARSLFGQIINAGTMTVNANTDLQAGSFFTNRGPVNIADNVTLTADQPSGPPASTFFNDTGGQVNSSGVAMTGAYIDRGNNFQEGAGTTNAPDVSLVNSSLSYTGSGASQIVAEGTGSLTGAPSAGQALTVLGLGCGSAATETLGASATNAGTITLSANTACSGNSSSLSIPSGDTLTNSGTLATAPGNGGARTITGAITNTSTGTISVTAKTSYKPGTLFDNQGTVVATAALGFGDAAHTIVYNEAGSMKGPISVTHGTFKQGNGILKSAISANTVTVDFVGTGKGTIIAKKSGGVLEGTLVAGQGYTLEGLGCSSAVSSSTSGAVVNGGTITLTANTVCSGQADTLTIPAGSTLNNTGTITTIASNGGARDISGALTNSGAVTINANTVFTGGSWDNKGSVTIADSVSLQLAAGAGATFTNDAGGSVAVTGDGSSGVLLLSSGNSFVEGAGTTSGGPVVVDDSALSYTGGGASQIDAEGAGTLSGAPSAGQTLTVLGLGCSEAANETAAASFTNHGTIVLTANNACGGQSAAITLPSGGTLTNSGTLIAAAGNGGTRTLNGNLDNKGVVGPSDGPTLNVTGNFTNEAGGTVSVTVPTSTPTLTITGSATINGGTLKAVPQSGSSFTPGQMFPALNAGSVSGTFTTVVGGAGQTWTAVYTPTSVSLEYVAP